MVLLKAGRFLLGVMTCTLAAACATSPSLDTTGVNTKISPSDAVAAPAAHLGSRIQWGGHIISIVNENRSTRMEILSYPLARDGLPNTYRNPTGRFVVQHDGFLEPLDFASGKLLTVVGTVDSMVTTSVGDSRFLVPLVHARQVKLWPAKYGGGNRSRFGFGFGISIGL